MFRKFIGDKMSIEAHSNDGNIWEVTLHDRGHVTKYVDATTAEVDQLAREKGMRLDVRR